MAQLKINGKGPIAIGILLEDPKGKILLQLRDNKKNIHYPNCWSIFTGGLEEKDWEGNLWSSLQKGILRELSEELSITEKNRESPFILDSEIKLLWEGTYPDIENNYHDYQYVFHAKLNTPFKKLKLNEGQKLGLFSKEEIDNLKIAPSYINAIKKFFIYRKKEENLQLKNPLCEIKNLKCLSH